MKVLVTGDRNWTNREVIERELRKLPPGSIVVHGAARGADSIAGEIARRLGFEVRPYPADWDTHGKAAGPMRNAEMLRREHLLHSPIEKVLAFHSDFENSRGTKDMVTKAIKKSIPWELFSV